MAVDYEPQIGTVKSVSPPKAILIYLSEILGMILNMLIIGSILRPTKAVETVFQSPFTSLLGPNAIVTEAMSVVHRRIEIFNLKYSLHLQTIYTPLFA